jgi:catechol 2,3-dioxygenase-like lactoylglutathione lyase family enzyme
MKGIIGAHTVLYSSDPEADRAFFRDVLELRSVDVGRGWLIFAMPPSEAALHPVEASEQARPGDLLRADLYLMCDDVRALIRTLEAKHVPCSAIEEESWGLKTTFRLPSGGEIGLYHPRHPTAI